MPISNGWEACKSICQLYDQDKIVGKFAMRELKPPIFACTANVIDKELQARALDTGFLKIFEVPMKSQTIESEIMPLLKNNRSSLVAREIMLQGESKNN